MLRGDLSLGPLNLLLVFHVNCPGCFIHALPFASELHERYPAQGLRILALFAHDCEQFPESFRISATWKEAIPAFA